MDDTRTAAPDPEPVGILASGRSGDALADALTALETASPGDAPDLADAVAERLGAMLDEEGAGADATQA